MKAAEKDALLLQMVRIKVASLTPEDSPEDRNYWLAALVELETGVEPDARAIRGHA